MVRLTEISADSKAKQEKSKAAAAAAGVDSDFDTTDFETDASDSEAEFDDDDDDDNAAHGDVDDESFLERLSALRDVVSPHTRYEIGRRAGQVYALGKWVTSALGKTAWVLSTSALIVVLPLAMELEKENALTQFDNEQKMREQMLQAPSTPSKPATGVVPPGF
ncbi:mitochondrial import receptor subunit Tom22 [Sorochytrium milnesiophthora]